MFERLAHIKCLQRPGEAEALYRLATKAPYGSTMVELGTFHGYTAGVLGLAAEQIGANVITLDDYHDRHGERLPKHIGAAAVRTNLERAGLAARVTVLEGDSRTIPPDLWPIGLLWIDSTHTAEQLLAELAVWLPHVVVGGIVAFHDYGGANTPQLKPVIDAAFIDPSAWAQAAAFYTIIGFKRLR